MTTTVLECKRCGDVIETTARSVTLPFYCDECRDAEWKRGAMAPAAVGIPGGYDINAINAINATPTRVSTTGEYPFLGYVGEPCSCKTTAPANDPCDSASVEATTELIAALENEIADLKERNDWQSSQLNKMVDGAINQQKEIVTLKDVLDRKTKLAMYQEGRERSLSLTIDGLNTRIAQLEIEKERQGGAISRLFAENRSLEGMAKRLRWRIENLKKCVEDYRTRYRDMRDENDRLNERGPFARLFNW
jgi:endogenous inhibitor of DNA gyrase (YacG/DUF329 family)/uncharacterized small protein (DUF1192 family)